MFIVIINLKKEKKRKPETQIILKHIFIHKDENFYKQIVEYVSRSALTLHYITKKSKPEETVQTAYSSTK